MDDLLKLQAASGMDIADMLLENEVVLNGWEPETVLRKMDKVIHVMRASVKRGLTAEGVLPGGLKIHRRAKGMYERARLLEKNGQMGDALFCRMNAYALATSEENAAGHIVVTAPTNGAAGIIPATLEYLTRDCKIQPAVLRKGMLVAAMIGSIIKANASISGGRIGMSGRSRGRFCHVRRLFCLLFWLILKKNIRRR